MKIRWKTGDTAGKVEYLDYGAVQQALQADPESLEIIYGLDDPGAPGSAEGDAEQAPERVRHPATAPDFAEQQASPGPLREVPGRGAGAADAGRVGPTVAHTTEVLDPGAVNAPLPPGAPAPEKSARELALEGGQKVVDETNAKTEATVAQANPEEKEAAAEAEGSPAQEEPQRRGPGRPRKE
jgi:hypothetical protein